MKNIMRAQFYQIRHDKWLWLLFSGMLLLSLREMAGRILYSVDSLSGSYFAANIGDLELYRASYVILAAACLMGRDYGSRIIYQDVLYGYPRKDVFLGRAVPALFVTWVTAVILLFTVPVCSTLLYGWGERIAVTEFLFRAAIYSFLVLRLCCEVFLLTVVLQELYRVYAAAFLLYFAGAISQMADGIKTPYVLAYSADRELFGFESWMVSHIDGRSEWLYERTLSAGGACSFIAVSVGIGAACLLFAVYLFRIQDMDL